MIKPLEAALVSDGTSFYGTCVAATLNEMIAAIGEPHQRYHDRKVTLLWAFRFGGSVVTVYDWKEMPEPPERNPDSEYAWHIGTTGRGYGDRDATERCERFVKHIGLRGSHD